MPACRSRTSTTPTKFDPWFLRELERIVAAERDVAATGLPRDAGALRRLKALGFSDHRLAELTGRSEPAIAKHRAETRRHPGLQAHRHLRGRVRLRHALHVFHL